MKALATVPIIRIFDMSKALEFYRDYFGFMVARFDPFTCEEGGLSLELRD